MATRATRSQSRLFARLIAELAPEIRRAFMASVTDLHARVDWPKLIETLTAGNIEGAIAALNISPAAWSEYSQAMSNVYARAGASTIAQIQAGGVASIGVRFTMTNPRAIEWIRLNVTERVVGFSEEQKQVARRVIAEGYAQGQGPRTIATDLVGRVSGGVRQGGVLALDGPRAERLHKVSVGMRTPAGVRSLVIHHEDGTYGMRYKVNEATRQRIMRAYHAETAVPEAERAISERQYKNALLKDRGDTVASTEAANGVMSARMEAWEQTAEAEGYDASAIIKTWQHRRGSAKEFRPSHLAMSGQSVQGLHTPFLMSNGAQLQYAHDPSAPASEIINCGCDTTFRLSAALAGLK